MGPLDYEEFDMRKPVMKIPFEEERLYQLTQELYSSFFTPKYITRKLFSIRSLGDVKFLSYSAWKIFGHLLDFDENQTRAKWWSPKYWGAAAKSLFTHLFPKKEDKKVDEAISESARKEEENLLDL